MALSLDPTADATEVGTATSGSARPRAARDDDVGLPPGTVVGRYVIESVVGSGGMGVVFRARDPQLDRVVALKRLYPEQVAAYGEGRLLREARAMAQLSHPHVVAVYGVERWQGTAVLAMEFVEGRTLEQWLAEPHDPAEGLRLMLEAGEGLRAAHDAGMIHRDFKPSNVLVGHDGRARVVDFGLARIDPLSETPAGRERIEGTIPSAAEPRPPEPAELRTEAGRIVGTVAYMAPEQLLGMSADARSDQYAFCVSLWEVLCGSRPFHGHVHASLDAKLEGPPPWPSRLRTSSRVVAAIERGLSARPEARWSSMAALLEQLRDIRRPRLWLAPTLGVVVVAGLVASLVAYDEEPAAPPCTGAAEHLVGVWDEPRRAAVRQALGDAGEVHLRDTWPRIEPRLDAWAAGWAATHTAACEATSVRGEASEAELDERMACLRDARVELRAVVDALSEPSAADRAVALVTALPDAAGCIDVAAPRKLAVPAAPDPALAARVEALREGLVEVQTLVDAGRFDAARARLEPLEEPARAAGWPPLWIETLMLRGSIAQQTGEFAAAERDYVEAHALAMAEHRPAHAVRAAEHLIRVVGHLRARYDDAMAWSDAALALVRSEPEVAAHEAEVLEGTAIVLHEQGKYRESEELERRVLALRGDAAEPLELAATLDVLGSAVERQGRPLEAIEHQRRALEIRERELGPEHVQVAVTLNNLSSSLMTAGERGPALSLLERVLRIRERAYGPDSVQLVSVLNNLGGALIEEKDFAAAESHLQRMLGLLEASFPDGHPNLGSALVNLGRLRSAQGRLEEARDYYARSIEVWERTLGPTHPKLALSLGNLGHLARREGRPSVALEPFRRALAIREAALGSESPAVVESRVHLGLASLEAKDAREARSLAEQARRAVAGLASAMPDLEGLVGLLEGRLLLHERQAARAVVVLERARASGLTGVDAAEAGLALARAQWDAGGDRAGAEALARGALASFREHDHRYGVQRAEQWLAEHHMTAR